MQRRWVFQGNHCRLMSVSAKHSCLEAHANVEVTCHSTHTLCDVILIGLVDLSSHNGQVEPFIQSLEGLWGDLFFACFHTKLIWKTWFCCCWCFSDVRVCKSLCLFIDMDQVYYFFFLSSLHSKYTVTIYNGHWTEADDNDNDMLTHDEICTKYSRCTSWFVQTIATIEYTECTVSSLTCCISFDSHSRTSSQPVVNDAVATVADFIFFFFF